MQSDFFFICEQHFDACEIDNILYNYSGVDITIEVNDAKNCYKHDLQIENLDVLFKYRHISYVRFKLFDKKYTRLRFTHPDIKKLDVIFNRWCETKNVNAAIDDIINAGLERML